MTFSNKCFEKFDRIGLKAVEFTFLNDKYTSKIYFGS